MRFVFYTDVQLSGQTPKNRVDNYQKALVDKMEEVYEVARSTGADFIVCGGDLFNSHRIFSYELLSPVMDVLCDSEIDTYITIGQHDILGYNRDTYKSSTLAFVCNRCPALKVIWDAVNIGPVTLHSSHVWEDPKDACDSFNNSKQYNIMVAHHLLTNKKTIFDTVNTGDFRKWMVDAGACYDMVLSGDLHDGYDTHEVDGMWFCNPGSVARQAISDRLRMPRFAVIDVEPGEIPVIDVRDLACAKPGEDVFGESVAEIARTQAGFDPTVFVSKMEEFEADSADIHELIQKVGLAEGWPKEVLDYLASKATATSAA